MKKNRAEQYFEQKNAGRKGNRSDRGTIKRGASRVMAIAVFGTQLWDCSFPALAEATEWEGITQVSASEQYTELDTSAVSLIVEEVYVEAGGYAQEGQSILKITDESYQKALDYYAAAIIYAQNDLTDAQMNYDIGMQEAEYSLELARAEAEQAEFVREQHLKELEDTIEEHEEIMTEIEDAIGEYEAGIAAGSYSSYSNSSGSSGSDSSSAGRGNSSSSNEEEKESESGKEHAPEPETEEEVPLDTEQSPESETYPGNESESEIRPDGETKETDTPLDTEDQLTELNQQIAAAGSKVSQLEDKVESISNEIEKKNEAYDETLKKMYQMLNLETGSFCGTGSVLLVNKEDGSIERTDENVTETEMLIDNEETEAEIETKTGTKTGSADDEEILPAETVIPETQSARPSEETSVTEAGIPRTTAVESQTKETGTPQAQATENSASETQVSEILLREDPVTETISSDTLSEIQMSDSESESAPVTEDALFLEEETGASEKEAAENANAAQTTGGSVMNTNENSGSGGSQNGVDESGTQNSEEETESEEEDTLDTLLIKLNGMEKERAALYDQLEAAARELETACAQLETLNDQKVKLLEGNQKETATETDASKTENTAEDGTGSENKNTMGEDAGTEKTPGNAGGTETNGTMGEGTGTDGGFAENSNSSAGSSSFTGGTPSAASDMASGSAVSGNSLSSGQTMTGGNGYTAGGMSSSYEIESLFGDTYDLTSVENLLERTASSEEEAESILEDLEAAAETVADQYAELIRNEKITRLEIQYTCDTAVIAGKLAEITYQQEVEELENSLGEAKSSVAELQEEESKLKTFADGVVPAGYTGSIAAVNYAAGDELNNSTALYSVYDTDVVTVTLAVSQYEISEFHVGDTVSVQLSGYGTREGTVSAKSPEASENSSRTSVNYEVEVTIDNSNGRLSSGVSAAVSREVAEDE